MLCKLIKDQFRIFNDRGPSSFLNKFLKHNKKFINCGIFKEANCFWLYRIYLET